MVLWETDGITVNDISQKLILNTNTITPLLKRMESNQIIERIRSKEDERKVIIRLTEKGRNLRIEAAEIPEKLMEGIKNDNMDLNELLDLKGKLYTMINYLQKKD